MDRAFISSSLGISGVERDHILDALSRQGIDWATVDWRTIGGDVADYGNRYEAIWERLHSMYGIPYPSEWRYKDYKKFKEQEYEYNAEQLKDYLRNHENVGYYNQVMNALCLGTEPVPEEIDEAIRYSGRERQAFISVLCRGYGRRYDYGGGTRWERIDNAVLNYRQGIKRFGVDNYAKCGDREGWYEVAECLHEAKKASISVEGMVRCYSQS